MIYIIGGRSTGAFSMQRYHKTVYKYKIVHDEFEKIANLNEARCAHSSCLLGSRLYVAGGTNGNTNLATIEYLDTAVSQPQQWEIFAVVDSPAFLRRMSFMCPLNADKLLITCVHAGKIELFNIDAESGQISSQGKTQNASDVCFWAERCGKVACLESGKVLAFMRNEENLFAAMYSEQSGEYEMISSCSLESFESMVNRVPFAQAQ